MSCEISECPTTNSWWFCKVWAFESCRMQPNWHPRTISQLWVMEVGWNLPLVCINWNTFICIVLLLIKNIQYHGWIFWCFFWWPWSHLFHHDKGDFHDVLDNFMILITAGFTSPGLVNFKFVVCINNKSIIHVFKLEPIWCGINKYRFSMDIGHPPSIDYMVNQRSAMPQLPAAALHESVLIENRDANVYPRLCCWLLGCITCNLQLNRTLSLYGNI